MKTDIAKADSPKMDKRSVRSRKWLLDALLELIKEKPFEEISVSEITDRADISRQTFYLHYYNKRDLLNELQDREFLQVRETQLEKMRSEEFNPTQMLNQMYSTWLDNAGALSPLLAADLDNRLLDKLRELTTEFVDIYIQRHDSVKDVRAAYVADFLSDGGFAILQRWIKNTDELSPAEIAEIIGTAAEAIAPLLDN